ncbi:DUF6888 family protein [Scytonema sp. NUACC26]|uniref:DUF6888 family protein n=1 Tax=Scytonema sp. NUACC26 TaxID=3140176 RepID=UPI0034DB7D37
MEPTVEQLKTYWRMSLNASNLLQPINFVRLDERNNRIVMLVADTIQIEIYPNGKVTVQ